MPMHRDILLLTGCMCLAQVNVSSTIAPTINLDSDSCFTVLLHRAEGLGNSARIVANSAKIPFRESPIAETPITESPIAESPIAEVRSWKVRLRKIRLRKVRSQIFAVFRGLVKIWLNANPWTLGNKLGNKLWKLSESPRSDFPGSDFRENGF